MKNNQRRPQRSFADGVAQLNQEAAGLFRVEVIRPEDHAPIAYALLGRCSFDASRCRISGNVAWLAVRRNHAPRRR